MDDRQPIIRLEGVSKAFTGQVVLNRVDLDVERGKTTVVIGPSGCGKSVLLKHMVGLIRPDEGKVFFGEHEISAMGERKLSAVRRRLGFLFQGAALFDSMTVEQNIRFPMAEHNVGSAREQTDRAREVLAMVELDGFQHRYPGELSGGEKKRVGLARAIALDPEVIFYDEPTTGLDPIRADLINKLLLKLHADLGTTSVVVTHDMRSAKEIADRIVMLHGGHFIADTTPQGLDQIDNVIVTQFVRGDARHGEPAGPPLQPTQSQGEPQP